MSIIYGYINLNSKPVERSILETMRHAMDFWRPDGEDLWVENTCGIGNLLYYNTPEAIFEKMPVTDASGNLVLSAGARIDNREELYTIFNVPLGQRLTMPDSALMLKAYEKWGEDCADHLVGDWAMAVWDKVKRKLFLARDHHGITALYYYKGEDFFVFSSSLKGILCLPQVPKKVNEYKIAQLLVNWNEGGPTTCYLDIMRLTPAHILTLADGKLTTNRYWFLEHTPEIRLKNDQEYADMFLYLYTEAVRHRLRSHRPVGATLSSGLDSGSVCILAAKELAKEGKRLQAYTSVPLYDVPDPPGRIGNEGPYALALAEKLGNVDVTLCNAENVGVLEGIEKRMKIHEQPVFSTLNSYWILDIFEKCKLNEKGTLLIGQYGNSTISWPPVDKTKKVYYFISCLIKRFKFELGLWEKSVLLNKELIHQYKLKQEIKKFKVAPYFCSTFSHKSRVKKLMPNSNIGGDLWFETGLSNKIEVRDPTIDLNLIKGILGVNSKTKYYNNTRTLLVEHFSEFLAAEIINRDLKGIQGYDLNQRLNANIIKVDPKIRSFLNNELVENITVSKGSLFIYCLDLFLKRF